MINIRGDSFVFIVVVLGFLGVTIVLKRLSNTEHQVNPLPCLCQCSVKSIRGLYLQCVFAAMSNVADHRCVC